MEDGIKREFFTVRTSGTSVHKAVRVTYPGEKPYTVVRCRPNRPFKKMVRTAAEVTCKHCLAY